MYILLALVAACALGIAAHFLIDGRDLRGAALTPGIATVVTAALYTGLQWAGLGEDNVWLWLISIPGGVVVAVAATIVLVAVRRRSDAAKSTALGI